MTLFKIIFNIRRKEETSKVSSFHLIEYIYDARLRTLFLNSPKHLKTVARDGQESPNGYCNPYKLSRSGKLDFKS